MNDVLTPVSVVTKDSVLKCLFLGKWQRRVDVYVQFPKDTLKKDIDKVLDDLVADKQVIETEHQGETCYFKADQKSKPIFHVQV